MPNKPEPLYKLISDLHSDLGRHMAETIATAFANFVETAIQRHTQNHITLERILDEIGNARELHEESSHNQGPCAASFTKEQERTIGTIALNTVDTHVAALHYEDDAVSPSVILTELHGVLQMIHDILPKLPKPDTGTADSPAKLSISQRATVENMIDASFRTHQLYHDSFPVDFEDRLKTAFTHHCMLHHKPASDPDALSDAQRAEISDLISKRIRTVDGRCQYAEGHE
jgi:hypothetical protein